MLAPHSALYHHRGEEAHRDTCAHSAIPNATHRPCYWICDWGKILHREARASVSRPPLPSHLLPAYVRNRHARLQELALPLTGGPGRGGAGREASVDKLCIHPPLLYDLSICPHGVGGRRKVNDAVEMCNYQAFPVLCSSDISLSRPSCQQFQ